MNHALKAAIALVMGAGLAASAQAHGTMHKAAAMTQRHAQTDLSRQKIKTAQQELKADGLYKGKVDGLFGPRTRKAVARFQQRNNLRRTATLNRRTLDRLSGNQAVGVGSSQPKLRNTRNANGNFNTNTNLNGAGSGSSSNSNATTPMMPPAANPSANGAGGNIGTTNQSLTNTNQSPTNNKY